ncbi:uncharacterized protein LOC143933184 [Lithobates pipiens]
MRILILYPALLFITAVQGHYIVQQDKPHEDEEPAIYKTLRDAAEIANGLRKNLENSKIVKEYRIKETLQAAVANAQEIESELEDHFDKVWKKIENFGQKFPIFTEKVLPILEDFANNLEEQAHDNAQELLSTATLSLYEMKNHLTVFLKKVETIARENRDELQSKIVELKDKAQPYMDDIRAEYDRNMRNM